MPYDAVVDMSGLTFVEPRGFLVVERDMRLHLVDPFDLLSLTIVAKELADVGDFA